MDVCTVQWLSYQMHTQEKQDIETTLQINKNCVGIWLDVTFLLAADNVCRWLSCLQLWREEKTNVYMMRTPGEMVD